MFGKMFTPQVVRKDNGNTVVKVGIFRFKVDPQAIAYDLGRFNRPVNAYYNVYHVRHYRHAKGYRFVAISPAWEDYIEKLNQSTYRHPRPVRW